MDRPRYHQPTGYQSSYGGEARRYYGRRHDYIFFPVAWTDAETGASYESGYYDENGVRYNNVALEKNGKYENVVCHCPYCGNESILTISASEPGEKSLACPTCGGTMEIRSALDEYLDDGSEDYTRGMEPERRTSHVPLLVMGIFIVVIAFICIVFFNIMRVTSSSGAYVVGPEDAGGTDTDDTIWLDDGANEDTIYLARTGDNSFTISDTAADKTLTWDDEADSYYDAETDCWLWYNTDVEPAVWQYWYEGISSEYGDYGWLEHYDDGWFIEEDYGNWVPLPEEFDDSGLWYIE